MRWGIGQRRTEVRRRVVVRVSRGVRCIGGGRGAYMVRWGEGAVDGKSRGRWLMWGSLFYNIVVFIVCGSVCGSVCGGVCIRCVVCGANILLNGSFDEVVRFQK